jgi:hypothetical protein
VLIQRHTNILRGMFNLLPIDSGGKFLRLPFFLGEVESIQQAIKSLSVWN